MVQDVELVQAKDKDGDAWEVIAPAARADNASALNVAPKCRMLSANLASG